METFEEIYKDCNKPEYKEVCYYCQNPLTVYSFEDCDGHKVCERCFTYLTKNN
jgi:hypothetical protein